MCSAIYLGPVISDTDPPIREPGADSGRLTGILDPTAVSLAREIAQDIHEVEDIILRFGYKGMDDPRWTMLKESRAFQTTLQDAIQEWNAADSTAKRIRYKAAASVEASLPEFHRAMVNPLAPLPARVEALKQMSRLAGMAEGAVPMGAPGAGASGFQLTINIGDGKAMTVSAAPRVIDVEADE